MTAWCIPASVDNAMRTAFLRICVYLVCHFLCCTDSVGVVFHSTSVVDMPALSLQTAITVFCDDHSFAFIHSFTLLEENHIIVID